MNCSCSDAYTGIGCQYEYDACAQGACQNGATCIDNGGPDYECICPPGYVGKNCEENFNNCPGNCPPAATCIDLVDNFHCRCPFNLTGKISIQIFFTLNIQSPSFNTYRGRKYEREYSVIESDLFLIDILKKWF